MIKPAEKCFVLIKFLITKVYNIKLDFIYTRTLHKIYMYYEKFLIYNVVAESQKIKNKIEF